MLTVYKSSAGAGKTFTLAKRYIDLLFALRGTRRHRKILAVTFTKKATAEMKNRIIEELNRLSTGADSPYLNDLQEKYKLSKEQVQDKARLILNDILQDYSAFSVNTIDSFFQQIIRSFAKELNLPTAYNLELDTEQILNRAVDDYFYSLPPEEDAHEMQLLYRVVSEKISDNKQWNPRNDILSLSKQLFNEVYQQNEQQINAFLDNPDNIKNYRKQLHSIIKKYWSDYREIEVKLDALMQDVDIKQLNYGENTLSPFHWHEEELNKFISGKLKIQRFLRCTTEDIDEVLKKPSVKYLRTDLQQLSILLSEYISGKKLCNYLTAKAILHHISYLEIIYHIGLIINSTNSELNRLPLAKTNQLLQEVISDNEEAPFVYDKIGNRLNHYMIDEFQDTSRLQWHNFRPLIREASARGNESLIVGDTKQSIYRWRNSDMHILQTEVKKDFPALQEKNLPSNWRSNHVIVEQNNHIFTLLMQAAQNDLIDKTAGVSLDFPIEITDIYSDIEQKPQKFDEDGYVRLEFISANNKTERMEQVFEKLKIILSDLQERHIPLGKIAFLVNRNREAAIISEFLLSNGYSVMSNEGLLLNSSPAVRLIIDILQLQLTPDDKILRKETHYQWLLCQGYSRDEAIDKAVSEPMPQELLFDTNDNETLYEHIWNIIYRLGLISSDANLPFIEALLDKVYNYTKKYQTDLYSFLEWWQENGNSAAIQMVDTDDAIQVMTIHKSKGLEFEIVIIPFCDWDTSKISNDDILWVKPGVEPFSNIPIAPVRMNKELSFTIFSNDYWREVQDSYLDSLNITYVAFTRAERELYVFAPTNEGKNANTIGGLLHSVLDMPDVYEAGKKVQNAEQQTEVAAQDHSPLSLSHTDNTDRLKILLPSRDYFLANNAAESSIDLTRRVNLGTVMHNILSHIKKRTDEEKALQKFLDEGIITQNDLPIVRKELSIFWTLTRDYDWFDGSWNVMNEQSIVLPNGDIRRPDRIMIKSNEAVIVDYKFGFAKPDKNKEQVEQYMQLLVAMGYSVKGYLCYVNRKELIEVI